MACFLNSASQFFFCFRFNFLMEIFMDYVSFSVEICSWGQRRRPDYHFGGSFVNFLSVQRRIRIQKHPENSLSLVLSPSIFPYITCVIVSVESKHLKPHCSPLWKVRDCTKSRAMHKIAWIAETFYIVETGREWQSLVNALRKHKKGPRWKRLMLCADP